MPTGIEAKGVAGGQLESIGQPVVKVSNNAVNNRALVPGDVITYSSRYS